MMIKRNLAVIVVVIVLGLLAGGGVFLGKTIADLQIQVNQMQGGLKIQQAQADYLQWEMKYLTHPDTIRRRTFDLLMKQGEFKEGQ